MDQLFKGKPAPAGWTRRERRGALVKELPAATGHTCPHALAAWRTKPPRTPSQFPDGTNRPAELVGGRMRRKVTPCTGRPGHHLPQDWNGGVATPHQTPDGRCWT